MDTAPPGGRAQVPLRRRGLTRRFSFSVGRVLSLSLSIFMRNFAPFAVLALLLYAPVMIVGVLEIEDALHSPRPSFTMPLTRILAQIVPFVLEGALAYGVFQEMRGTRASFLDCVKRGFECLAPVLGVAIVVSLVVVAALGVPVLLRVSMSNALGGLAMLVGIAIVVFVSLMWYVAVPAAVVEGWQNPLRALGRSANLTRKWHGQIFLILLTFGLLGWVLSFISTSVLLASARSVTGLEVLYCVQLGILALLGAWQAAAAAVAYHDLRAGKEGVGIAEIVRVFD